MSTDEKLKHSAEELAHYLEHRALGESKESKLDADYFYDLMKKGVFTFFGIVCHRETGAIIQDNQNPEGLKKYHDDIKASLKEETNK